MTTPSLEPDDTQSPAGELAPVVGGGDSSVSPLTTVNGAHESVTPSMEEPSIETSDQRESAPGRTHEGWSLIALLPYDGYEPPGTTSDAVAQAVWCAATALWHPTILARANGLPRFESIDSPSPPGAREIRIVPTGASDRLPSGYRTQAEDARTSVIESGTDRTELIQQIQARVGAHDGADDIESEGMVTTARDFLALGTIRWMLRDLVVAMGHADTLDYESLTRELLAGAHAWQIGDWAAATNRLRAGFEIMTQARERFYPVDAYLIDLCFLDAAMTQDVLTDTLAIPVAISFIATAQAIENQAMHAPQRLAALRQAISDGWADVAGGSYSEAEDSLLPLESLLWQLGHGANVYREHLDDRNAETFARRRFGLHPRVPQIAKRFGFQYALHMSFDAGRFPLRPETKRLWESSDGSSLESLLRPPLAADRPMPGWLLPWRLAAAMKNDHVAALPLVHWPAPVAPWYIDLRRAAPYSPVLGRWTTLNGFFHLTDRPYETFRPDADLYQSPYLAQAVSRREGEPIGRMARHHQLRARCEGARAIAALARAIASSAPAAAAASDATISDDAPPFPEIETLIETGRHAEAATALAKVEIASGAALSRHITGRAMAPSEPAGESSRAGYLVFNPLNVRRRAAVTLPDAALDLRPEGPLRSGQFTDEGVCAVVDLPAFGFAWVPRESDPTRPAASATALGARDRKLRNETTEIEIDATTGGIRGITRTGEPTARLGQQLVMTGFADASGKPVASQMRCERIDMDYGGPALVQATVTGHLVHPQQGNRLASFVQRYRLWTGRPILEIEVTIDDLDPDWQSRAGQADPWSVYLACRWAWPDPNSMLRRGVFGSPELTELERPESPDFFDLSTRTQRTALLFGGLPYHRKLGGRMLDTLLIAGAEATRSFRLGVVLDEEHPFRAAQDFLAPPMVVPVDDGPPAIGTTGWLARIDHAAVAVSRVEFVSETDGDRGWALVFHVLETTGSAARCRLRLFRNPTFARQTDFLGETLVDLSVDGDAVSLDLTPLELARVEVTFN